MGKKGAGDFADRGLQRTLVDNSDPKMGEAIFQEVLAFQSPLRVWALVEEISFGCRSFKKLS